MTAGFCPACKPRPEASLIHPSSPERKYPAPTRSALCGVTSFQVLHPFVVYNTLVLVKAQPVVTLIMWMVCSGFASPAGVDLVGEATGVADDAGERCERKESTSKKLPIRTLTIRTAASTSRRGRARPGRRGERTGRSEISWPVELWRCAISLLVSSDVGCGTRSVA